MRQFRILERKTHKGKITYRVQMGALQVDFWVGCSVEYDDIEDARRERDRQRNRQVVSERVVE